MDIFALALNIVYQEMDIIELVKHEVSKVSPKHEVILFGSRARGDFREDSDWDFLILLEDIDRVREVKKEIIDKLYEIELETGQIISTLIYAREEWEKRSVMPLYQIISEEGVRA